ncbi:MAG: hypothetical protein J1F03_08705 [Oscillospiraceae bacterium]|nr:hypothetical protein [Oscillospiraceae bacterium]
MAFCDLKPVRVSDDKTGATYVIGEVIAAYNIGSPLPTVYSWDMVKSVSITRREMIFSFLGSKTNISFSNKMFRSSEEALRAIAIIECQSKANNFTYLHEKRLFPLKSLYRECFPGKESYVGEGMLDEADTAAALLALLNFRLMKFLWLVALLITLITFGVLSYTIGLTRDNILYFILISVASGGIFALIVYMITHAAARARVKSFADADLASKEAITYVISKSGFAACESCIYQSRDLVSWEEADYFVESDKMFIIFKGRTPLAFIPKKVFSKKYIGGVTDIIALSLEQR